MRMSATMSVVLTYLSAISPRATASVSTPTRARKYLVLYWPPPCSSVTRLTLPTSPVRRSLEMKKLRPSPVGGHDAFNVLTNVTMQPSTQSTMHNDVRGENDFASVLNDGFFHQHGELKDICEFALPRVLLNLTSKLPEKVIQPLVQSVDKTSNAADVSFIEAKCWEYLEKNIAGNIRTVLEATAPASSDPLVIDMALSLAVSHGLVKGQPLLAALVASEMKQQHREGIVRVREPEDVVMLQSITNVMLKLVASLTPVIPARAIKDMEELIHLLDQHPGVRFLREDALRPFFGAVLELNRCTAVVFDRSMDTASKLQLERWNLLSVFLHVAAKLSVWSDYGLNDVKSRLADATTMEDVMELGLMVDRSESISVLLMELLQAKLVKPSLLKLVLHRFVVKGMYDVSKLISALERVST